MKKKLAIICCLALVLASVFTVMVACDKTTTLSDESLKTLRSNLYNMYKDDATEQTQSYKVIGTVSGFDADGNPIDSAIKWTIDGTDQITISEADADGNYTVNVPDPYAIDASISYTLVATLVDANGEAYTNADDNHYSVSFPRTLTKQSGVKADAVMTLDSTGKATLEGETITWVDNGITVVNKKANSSTTPAVYSNPGRFYKGTTIDVSYTAPIKAIRLTVDLSYSTGFDGMSVAGATIQHQDDIVIISFENPVEKFESAPLAAQTRIYTIEVYTSSVPEMEQVTRPETEEEILAALKQLAEGETLAGGQYTLTGEIIDIKAYNSQYNSIELTIAVGADKTEILCYSMKGGEELGVGDVIKVTGYMKNYNGTLEFTQNCTYVIVSGGNHETPTPGPGPSGDSVGTIDAPVSVAEAIAAANKLESGSYSEAYYYVKGVVTNITFTGDATKSWSFEMTDEGGKDVIKGFYVYLSEGMSTLNVGDVVIVYGTLQNFNGTPEITVAKDKTPQATIVKIVNAGETPGGEDQPTPGPSGDSVGTIDAPVSVAEAIAAANKLEAGSYSEAYYYVKGVVTNITYKGDATKSWSFEMTDEGRTDIIKGFYVYLSEGMSTLNVGDVVIVYGTLQNFNGTPEITVAKDKTPQATIVKIVSTGSGSGTTTPGTGSGDLPEATLVATLDTKGTTNRKSFSDEQVVYEANGVKYTQDKAASSTKCWDANGTSFETRAYANSNITIEFTSPIKYIVLHCYSGNKTLNGQTFDGLTIIEDASANTVTIVLDNPATSVTLVKLAKQLRIGTIEIYA